MMNCRISLHGSIEAIPQIINGASANTMFYLINYKLMDGIKCYENISFPSLPRDLGDFSRCALASDVFNWTVSNLQDAIDTAKQLNYSENFIKFLSKFTYLYEEFIGGNEQIVKQFLEELKC